MLVTIVLYKHSWKNVEKIQIILFIRQSNADCSETFHRLVCDWQFNADYSASGRGSVGGVSQINLRPIYVVDPMFLSQGGNPTCVKKS